MVIPWLIPIFALAAIVAFVVVLHGRRRRGKLPHDASERASSSRS